MVLHTKTIVEKNEEEIILYTIKGNKSDYAKNISICSINLGKVKYLHILNNISISPIALPQGGV